MIVILTTYFSHHNRNCVVPSNAPYFTSHVAVSTRIKADKEEINQGLSRK